MMIVIVIVIRIVIIAPAVIALTSRYPLPLESAHDAAGQLFMLL